MKTPIWFVPCLCVLTVLLLVFGIQKISKLTSEKALMQQNIAALGDSLKMYSDGKTEAYAKLAFIRKSLDDSIDGLNTVLGKNVKHIAVLSNTVIELKTELANGGGVVTPPVGHSNLYTLPIYDTTGFIHVVGYVTIDTTTLQGKYNWTKSVKPFGGKILVYIDKDNHISAAVQPADTNWKITKLETVVSSDYILPTIETSYYSSIWKRLGVYGNTSFDD